MDRLLLSWHPEDRLPPRFQERVWRRISLQEEARPAAVKLWEKFLSGCFAVFGRPALAACYLAVLMATGAGLGYWQSERYGAQTVRAWQAAYVHSVNPYAAAWSK